MIVKFKGLKLNIGSSRLLYKTYFDNIVFLHRQYLWSNLEQKDFNSYYEENRNYEF